MRDTCIPTDARPWSTGGLECGSAYIWAVHRKGRLLHVQEVCWAHREYYTDSLIWREVILDTFDHEPTDDELLALEVLAS